MQLDHERLDVYDLALEFLVLANGIIDGLPRGRSHLADQFTRASLSIVLNLAEGAGKHSKLDKRRYYVTARGSATESAALLVPLLAQRSNRLNTVFQGPKSLGRSRHGAPVRLHHSTASTKLRSSRPGRPARFLMPSAALILCHCRSSNCKRTIVDTPWSTPAAQ